VTDLDPLTEADLRSGRNGRYTRTHVGLCLGEHYVKIMDAAGLDTLTWPQIEEIRGTGDSASGRALLIKKWKDAQ